jgi:hypothetical protein
VIRENRICLRTIDFAVGSSDIHGHVQAAVFVAPPARFPWQRRGLALENPALREQLAVLKRQCPPHRGFLLQDRDKIYSDDFHRRVTGMGNFTGNQTVKVNWVIFAFGCRDTVGSAKGFAMQELGSPELFDSRLCHARLSDSRAGGSDRPLPGVEIPGRQPRPRPRLNRDDRVREAATFTGENWVLGMH